MYRQPFVYPSNDGDLGCFQILATVNNTAVNMSAQISVQFPGLIFLS